MKYNIIKNEYFPVILLCLIFLIIGLFMVNYRWINPDEGAHLADAKLLLEGKIPLVDYSSRQPFYVFLLAIFLKIFGMNCFAGRLLPIISSVGVSFLIYLIAKKLFNKEVGLASQIIYLFLPFTILFMPVAKMHNIVIFWGTLGVLF